MLQRQNQPKKVEEEKKKKKKPWYVSTILQGNIDAVLCHFYWIYPTRLWDVKQTDIFSSLRFILISSEAVIFSLETGSVDTKKKNSFGLHSEVKTKKDKGFWCGYLCSNTEALFVWHERTTNSLSGISALCCMMTYKSLCTMWKLRNIYEPDPANVMQFLTGCWRWDIIMSKNI